MISCVRQSILMNAYTLTSLTTQRKWSTGDYIYVHWEYLYLSSHTLIWMYIHIPTQSSEGLCISLCWNSLVLNSLLIIKNYIFHECLKDFTCLLYQAQIPPSAFKTQPLQPNLLCQSFYHSTNAFHSLN